MSILLRASLLCLALWAGGEACAQAPAANPNSPSPRAMRRDPRIDAARAADSVRRAERETGGEVLRAEPMQRGGREVYRLKVLTPEGRVRVMQEDPTNWPDRSRAGSERREPPADRDRGDRDGDHD